MAPPCRTTAVNSRSPKARPKSASTSARCLAKSKVTLTYDVVADSAVESVPSLGPSASFSSREIGVPIKANTSEPLSLAELTHQISQIPGVARAEPLSLVDLAPGSLSAGSKRPPEAVRVFGLDHRYLEQDPSIRIVEGSYEPGSGLLSAEAARALSISPGGVVQIRVPGMSQPLSVRISGITDVSRAKSLFYSREENSSSSLSMSATR